MPPNHDLVTPSEAARLLGVSRQRVHELVELGRLKALRSARHIYIERASINERVKQDELSDKWLTTADVAARFDVSLKTVRRWVSEGRLNAVAPHGRALRYDPQEIRRFRPPLLGGRRER